MDFFKSVSARVGDVAKNVGDLLLDSDSESEADERSERTRRGGDDADRGEGSGPGGRRSRAGGDGVAERGAGGASDSEGSEEDDGPLISEDVWNTLRAAKDRVAQAAKTTVASVSRDVAAAAETVRRDLGDLSNLPGESTNEGPVVFVGDAASEYAAGGAGGLGVSVESDDDDDDDGSDGDGSLDPDVAETFERTAEALENVGEKVERFGAAVFQNAGRLFDKIVDTFEEDETDRGQGAAAPPGSYGVRARPKLVDTTRVSGDSSSSLRHRSPNTAADTPDSVFEKKVAAMQRDSSTYCDEPAESEAFATFAKTFDASSDDVKKMIDQLLSSNSFMKTMSSRIVPAVVEHDVFWSRYFFRLRTLERERDGWEEPLPTKTLLEPSGMDEPPAGTAAGASEENAPDASADSTPFSDSPERTSPETKVNLGEGAQKGEEEGEDARGEEEEEEETDEEEGTLPASGKTETDCTLSTEIVHERVVVAGDETSDDGVASAPGHRRVVSLATDDGTVASDDSLGKDWTRVRDVESPSSGRDEAVEADVRGAVHANADEDEDDEKIDEAGGSAESTKNASASRTRPAESSLSVAKPPPEAKDPPGVLEDSDLDEDWGMDSD